MLHIGGRICSRLKILTKYGNNPFAVVRVFHHNLSQEGVFMKGWLNMNKTEELIQMLAMLQLCVVPDSFDRKVTILDDIKPSSFHYVIKSTIDFLEQLGDENDNKDSIEGLYRLPKNQWQYGICERIERRHTDEK